MVATVAIDRLPGADIRSIGLNLGAFGIRLNGRGSAYINHLSLDEVGAPVKPKVQLDFQTE